MGASEFASVYNTTRGSCLGEQIGIADTSLKRMVGLLGRRSPLEPGSGLYIMPSQAIHTFGMAFAIDVVFINKKHHVVGIRKNVPPLRITRVFWSALGVLELPPGTIESSQTQLGDELKFQFASQATAVASSPGSTVNGLTF